MRTRGRHNPFEGQRIQCQGRHRHPLGLNRMGQGLHRRVQGGHRLGLGHCTMGQHRKERGLCMKEHHKRKQGRGSDDGIHRLSYRIQCHRHKVPLPGLNPSERQG